MSGGDKCYGVKASKKSVGMNINLGRDISEVLSEKVTYKE